MYISRAFSQHLSSVLSDNKCTRQFFHFSFRIHDTDIIQLPYLQEISVQILLKSNNGPVMQLPSNNKKNFKVTENIDGQIHCVVRVTTQ